MPPRLIHLNGAPGVGKSTLARRYAVEHPGVLLLDVDVLRGFLPGLTFADAGAQIRPLALAMLTAHLAGGQDVVLPQFLGLQWEVERFAAAAQAGGGSMVEVLLEGDPAEVAERFERRGDDDSDPDPWHDEVRTMVGDAGGAEHLDAMMQRLREVTGARTSYRRVRSVEGEVDVTYAALLEVLAG